MNKLFLFSNFINFRFLTANCASQEIPVKFFLRFSLKLHENLNLIRISCEVKFTITHEIFHVKSCETQLHVYVRNKKKKARLFHYKHLFVHILLQHFLIV